MGSRGSVIPILLKQNQNKKNFSITDNRMTRFNITLKDAVKFVINSLFNMKGGEIFIPKCPSYRIMDIANSINSKAKIDFIGIRAGEKLHEELINKSEYFNTIERNNDYIIYPLKKNIKKVNSPGISYNSLDNPNYLSVKEIKNLIKQNILDFET
tara:strand:- start:113 stop:577 length:465 start_codon:yes stop_codon:yes gene_type:complete